MEELVYFELNNWTPDKDYPNKPQFTKWVGNVLTDSDNNEDWEKDTFCDNEYAKKNELVISFGLVDMSFDFCVVAKKSWVEKNCPSLLDEDSRFLAQKILDEENEEYESHWGLPFLEYNHDNFGFHYFSERYDPDGGYIWEERTH